MSEKFKSFQYSSLWLASMILIMVLASGLYLAYHYVNLVVEEECYNNLSIACKQFSDDVKKHFDNRQVEMKALAELIAEEPDIRNKERVLPLLKAFSKDQLAWHTQLIYPDHLLLRDNGEMRTCKGKLDFAREAGLGMHVTEDMFSIINPDKKILRIMAPVEKNGQVVALASSTVFLEDMQNFFKVDIYRGRAQLFIVDAANGHYLLDNWHQDLTSNISMLATRSYYPGYKPQDFLDDLHHGISGRTLFKSRTAGEYLYTYYRPIGINNWQGIVSVLKPDALALADATTKVMTRLVILYVLTFTVFLGWVLYLRHRARNEQERVWRLDLNTGLANRNAYIKLLTDFKVNPGQELTCVYLDVNGLHEMNNLAGHEAGDLMLNAVADALRKYFPAAYLFRLGGDEFLVIAKGVAEIAVLKQLDLAQKELLQHHYSVSIGVEHDESGRNLELVVNAADKKMLAAKRAYYASLGDRRRRL